MSGILYVVATPIGNLEDVTLRALRVLREVSIIAAEDTRRTARLLQHYSISTRTTSLHEHNERQRTPALIKRLQAGESVALVSDAGTPVLSDPGTWLVAAAHRAGIRVEPVPGPSAAMAALSASGLPASEVLFLGFPPSRAKARNEWLRSLASERRTLVVYEAPHRIRQSLADIQAVLGDRTVALGRELTKAHEELVVSPISGIMERLGEPRGEYTLIIAPPNPEQEPAPQLPQADALRREFGEMTKLSALSRRDLVRQLADRYGVGTRAMYALLEAGPK
jgi:16S rRNA (cytidine1402-2'-O)-methyltransferase